MTTTSTLSCNYFIYGRVQHIINILLSDFNLVNLSTLVYQRSNQSKYMETWEPRLLERGVMKWYNPSKARHSYIQDKVFTVFSFPGCISQFPLIRALHNDDTMRIKICFDKWIQHFSFHPIFQRLIDPLSLIVWSKVCFQVDICVYCVIWDYYQCLSENYNSCKVSLHNCSKDNPIFTILTF